MRVLMLAQFYPPTMGGEERHVRNLAAALAARGHDVAVATLWHHGLAEFEQDGLVRVYRMRGTVQRADWLFSESGRRHAPPFPDPELVLALRRIVAEERPQIVHAHNWLVHSFLPLAAWSGAKLVLTLHDYSLVCVQKRLMYRDQTLCSGPQLTKCLKCAVSHYGLGKGLSTLAGNWSMSLLERQAVAMFLPVSGAVATQTRLAHHKVPFDIIPNFVPDDLGMQPAVIDEYVAQLPSEPYILMVGDLSHDKGIGVLLQAYQRLHSAPPLVLIGRRNEDTPTSLPANTTILEQWPHAAVMAAWQRCIVAVVPSVCPDACPTVVMEAMTMSRAVIGSAIGGVPDLVIDGETGLLVPPEDVQALTAALHQLLTDSELRDRMGQAGRSRVKQYYASAVVPRIERVYQHVLYGPQCASAAARL